MTVLTVDSVWALLTPAEQTALMTNGFGPTDTVRMFRMISRLGSARVTTLLTAFNALTPRVAATVASSTNSRDLPLPDGRFWLTITQSISDGTQRKLVALCASNVNVSGMVTQQIAATNAQLVADASYP